MKRENDYYIRQIENLRRATSNESVCNDGSNVGAIIGGILGTLIFFAFCGGCISMLCCRGQAK